MSRGQAADESDDRRNLGVLVSFAAEAQMAHPRAIRPSSSRNVSQDPGAAQPTKGRNTLDTPVP
jgi:hypothetical protein